MPVLFISLGVENKEELKSRWTISSFVDGQEGSLLLDEVLPLLPLKVGAVAFEGPHLVVITLLDLAEALHDHVLVVVEDIRVGVPVRVLLDLEGGLEPTRLFKPVPIRIHWRVAGDVLSRLAVTVLWVV